MLLGAPLCCPGNDTARANQQLAPFLDTAAVKNLVAVAAPNVRVAKTLLAVSRADELTDAVLARLPSRFVMKATHGPQLALHVDGDDGLKCILGENDHAKCATRTHTRARARARAHASAIPLSRTTAATIHQSTHPFAAPPLHPDSVLAPHTRCHRHAGARAHHTSARAFLNGRYCRAPSRRIPGQPRPRSHRDDFVRRNCEGWLDYNYSRATRQASYAPITPRCIFEDFTDGGGVANASVGILVIRNVGTLVALIERGM